jgi:hypothetical protein
MGHLRIFSIQSSPRLTIEPFGMLQVHAGSAIMSCGIREFSNSRAGLQLTLRQKAKQIIMPKLTLRPLRAKVTSALIVVTFLAAPATWKAQTLVSQKLLSDEAAFAVVHGARDKCHADGYHVSISLLDSSRTVEIQLRGNAASPHTLEHSRRKAYTALTYL